MPKLPREFQIFVKPAGAVCNLACDYCYYLIKKDIYPDKTSFRMSEKILELYIIQHIEASSEQVISFSWHGGEPTVLGLDFFEKIVALQKKYLPAGRRVANGIQTNGTLLDKEWCQFFANNDFYVGISLDGPKELHDLYRRTKGGKPSFDHTLRGYKLLQEYAVSCEILCVVNAQNVRHPLKVYRFFKQLDAQYVSLLPLVEIQSKSGNSVTERSVSAEAWGSFLCTIYDEWIEQDIGKVKIQIFEEAARPAFGQDHTLCIFRETCGDVPVIEHNGDFYSCDHFVDAEHYIGNISETPLFELLESPAQRAFGRGKLSALPRYCRECEVRNMCNGGCPKNRFIKTPDGEDGLNYLCAGYKQFFNHCQPFIKEVAVLWKDQAQKQQSAKTRGMDDTFTKVGRNDPCPCGSGKKYKNCCGKP